MNEVRPTQLANQLAARTASSNGSVANTSKPESGNNLPVSNNTDVAVKAESGNRVDLKEAVADFNQHVQNINRDLHFSIDDNSGRTVIRVVDRASGDLIRQIPEDIFLHLARNLKDNEPIHLVNARG